MRTLTEEPNKPATPVAPVAPPHNLETFSATLRDGRIITIREMTGKDLVHIEEDLANMGETRRSFKIIELLNVGTDKVSYNEIEELGVRDIKLMSDLVAKANGDESSGGDDPKFR